MEPILVENAISFLETRIRQKQNTIQRLKKIMADENKTVKAVKNAKQEYEDTVWYLYSSNSLSGSLEPDREFVS